MAPLRYAAKFANWQPWSQQYIILLVTLIGHSFVAWSQPPQVSASGRAPQPGGQRAQVLERLVLAVLLPAPQRLPVQPPRPLVVDAAAAEHLLFRVRLRRGGAFLLKQKTRFRFPAKTKIKICSSITELLG